MLDLGVRHEKTPRGNRSQILHIKERSRGKVTDNVQIRVDEKEFRLLIPFGNKWFHPQYQSPSGTILRGCTTINSTIQKQRLVIFLVVLDPAPFAVGIVSGGSTRTSG